MSFIYYIFESAGSDRGGGYIGQDTGDIGSFVRIKAHIHDAYLSPSAGYIVEQLIRTKSCGNLMFKYHLGDTYGLPSDVLSAFTEGASSPDRGSWRLVSGSLLDLAEMLHIMSARLKGTDLTSSNILVGGQGDFKLEYIYSQKERDLYQQYCGSALPRNEIHITRWNHADQLLRLFHPLSEQIIKEITLGYLRKQINDDNNGLFKMLINSSEFADWVINAVRGKPAPSEIKNLIATWTRNRCKEIIELINQSNTSNHSNPLGLNLTESNFNVDGITNALSRMVSNGITNAVKEAFKTHTLTVKGLAVNTKGELRSEKFNIPAKLIVNLSVTNLDRGQLPNWANSLLAVDLRSTAIHIQPGLIRNYVLTLFYQQYTKEKIDYYAQYSGITPGDTGLLSHLNEEEWLTTRLRKRFYVSEGSSLKQNWRLFCAYAYQNMESPIILGEYNPSSDETTETKDKEQSDTVLVGSNNMPMYKWTRSFYSATMSLGHSPNMPYY